MLKSVCEHTQSSSQNMMEILLLSVFLKKHEDAMSIVEKASLWGETKQSVDCAPVFSVEVLMHEED